MHFYLGTMTTHAESINSDLQRGLDRHLLHTQHTGFLQSLENLENLENLEKHSNFTSVREKSGKKNWELRKVGEKSGNFINRSWNVNMYFYLKEIINRFFISVSCFVKLYLKPRILALTNSECPPGKKSGYMDCCQKNTITTHCPFIIFL